MKFKDIFEGKQPDKEFMKLLKIVADYSGQFPEKVYTKGNKAIIDFPNTRFAMEFIEFTMSGDNDDSISELRELNKKIYDAMPEMYEENGKVIVEFK